MIRVWALVAGAEVGSFLDDSIAVMAFAPDGRTFATGGLAGIVRLWDVAALFGETGRSRDKLWADLKGNDPVKAFRAQQRLLAEPAAIVAAVRKQAAPPVDRRLATRLIADLDRSSYAVRAQATTALLRMGAGVAPLVKERLAKPPSLEATRRLELLLREYERRELLPENLWRFRAVALLEHGGTAEARSELARLAVDAPGLLLMREARLALQRLKARAL